MFDAYFHLAADAADPLADLDRRLLTAGVKRALVVETWAGKEKAALETLVARGADDRPVAFCFRGQSLAEIAVLLESRAVLAIRAKTSDLDRPTPWLDLLEQSNRILLCHGEAGIGRLAEAVDRIARLHPRLRIYVPHLGWPRRNQADDPEWSRSVAALAALPKVVMGISALGAFSRTAFPHDDLLPIAMVAIERFGPDRLVAATDYPNFNRELYSKLYHVARSLISGRWPEWKDDNALRP